MTIFARSIVDPITNIAAPAIRSIKRPNLTESLSNSGCFALEERAMGFCCKLSVRSFSHFFEDIKAMSTGPRQTRTVANEAEKY